MKGMTVRLGLATALCLFSAGFAPAAPVSLSGMVRHAQTGLPISGLAVGATRVSVLPGSYPDEPIIVEATAITNANGVFSYTADDSYPGLDRVLLFTMSPNYCNRIYKSVTYSGIVPTYTDLELAGVVAIDCRTSVSGIRFLLEPLVLPGKTTFMVPMTDGALLATDVYLPEGAGPWPVILYRTPYGKNYDNPGTEYLTRGYAVVAQDLRGTIDSQGLFRFFLDDGWGENKDGYDTCRWILDQPWCNGKIATTGASACGITENMLAGASPPGLVCQHVSLAASDLYSQMLFHGGAFRRRLVYVWITDRGPFAYDYLMAAVTDNPFYSDQLWALSNLETRAALVKWPVVHRGGWYDIFLRGTIDNFVNLQHNGGPGAAGNQRLIIEPYGHGQGSGGFYWPAGCQSPPAPYNTPLDWFDELIKGIDRNMTDAPPVCYYVMGDVDDPEGPGNEWRYADDWPVPSTPVNFYFHHGGALSTMAPKVESDSQSYVFDPANPVPTLGGANLTGERGPYDQRPVESRPDVLVFTSTVLGTCMEITGKVVVRLWASSSAADTDFTAKLCDVYPDGRSMLVCDGIVRARHRNTPRYAEFLTPGEIYEFEIDLWETCIAFNAGHRIRVSLSSSNYDRYDVNPNTGEPWNQHTHMVSATNTVYFDAAHPSHIVLPVTNQVPQPVQYLPAVSLPGILILAAALVAVIPACRKWRREKAQA